MKQPILIVGLLALLMSPVSAMSQTVLEQSESPPVKPGQASAPVAPFTTSVETVTEPLPESVAEDALAQREGTFPEMRQPGLQSGIPSGGGMIQHAWNHAPQAAGVADYAVCGRCVYRVRTREMMVTTIILPEGARVTQADLGDPASFDVEIRSANMLAIRPANYGTDTNLNVYTDAGVFAFYLRSEGFNSGHVPDLLVRVSDPDGVIKGVAPKVEDVTVTSKPVSTIISKDNTASIKADKTISRDDSVLSRLKPRHESGDFVERVEFDPGKLHGFDEYELWGDEAMAPETIFRDEHFTYIQFGDKWNSIELPVAFVVIDSIDEQVNTRVQGRTYIIESVAPLITLKSGTSFICIKYGGTA